MSFDKEKDQIAITIPRFRMRKSADLGKNEIGIVTIAIDSSGTSNPTPTLFTNSFFIPNVKKWSWVDFGGHGRIVYGPKNPGSFIYYNVLFVESDQDVREFGETLSTIFESNEVSTVVKALATPNPTTLLVSNVVSELGKLVSKLLKKNKNDLIYSTEGSFFQATNPPYNIGDTFSTQGEHIECSIRVLPLHADNGRMNTVPRSRYVSKIKSELITGLDHNSSTLELEKLAGTPEMIDLTFDNH